MPPALQSALMATLIVLVIGGSGWVALSRRLRSVERALGEKLDQLVARLERLEPKAAPEPTPATAAVSPPALPPAQPRRIERRDASAERPYNGPTLIEVPSIALSGSEELANASATELAGRFSAIWALADAGASADSIAQTTRQPVGQVELILGLRRPTASSVSSSMTEGRGT